LHFGAQVVAQQGIFNLQRKQFPLFLNGRALEQFFNPGIQVLLIHAPQFALIQQLAGFGLGHPQFLN